MSKKDKDQNSNDDEVQDIEDDALFEAVQEASHEKVQDIIALLGDKQIYALSQAVIAGEEEYSTTIQDENGDGREVAIPIADLLNQDYLQLIDQMIGDGKDGKNKGFLTILQDDLKNEQSMLHALDETGEKQKKLLAKIAEVKQIFEECKKKKIYFAQDIPNMTNIDLDISALTAPQVIAVQKKLPFPSQQQSEFWQSNVTVDNKKAAESAYNNLNQSLDQLREVGLNLQKTQNMHEVDDNFIKVLHITTKFTSESLHFLDNAFTDIVKIFAKSLATHLAKTTLLFAVAPLATIYDFYKLGEKIDNKAMDKSTKKLREEISKLKLQLANLREMQENDVANKKSMTISLGRDFHKALQQDKLQWSLKNEHKINIPLKEKIINLTKKHKEIDDLKAQKIGGFIASTYKENKYFYEMIFKLHDQSHDDKKSLIAQINTKIDTKEINKLQSQLDELDKQLEKSKSHKIAPLISGVIGGVIVLAITPTGLCHVWQILKGAAGMKKVFDEYSECRNENKPKRQSNKIGRQKKRDLGKQKRDTDRFADLLKTQKDQAKTNQR